MTAPLRLLVLTQYFPPETGAPQARLSEMGLLLKEKGVEVEILTAMPNYPAGKIFDGYQRRWMMQEEWRGLKIIRSFIYPTKSPKIVPRLLNYFSFVFSSMIAGIFKCGPCDIILVESPPLFLGISGYILKLLKGAKMVFNVSDLWPETAIALGLYGRESGFVKLAVILEKFLYKNAAACTGQSFGIVRGIVEKTPSAKISLIPNGADCKTFTPERRNAETLREWVLPGKTIIGYAGLIGLAQGIKIILDTARHFENDSDIIFLIAGDGPEREMLEKEAGPNVIFTGLVAKEKMPDMVAAFDMTIIPLKKHIPGALPSKMYEAMASEVPIILAADGDPRELLERANAGIAVDYDNIETVAAAVKKLKDNEPLRKSIGRDARAYVLAHHERRAIADKLLMTLTAITTHDDSFFDNERNNARHEQAAKSV